MRVQAFRIPYVLVFLLLAAAGGLILSGNAATAAPEAQTGKAWPQLSVEHVVSGLTDPTHLTHAGDGTGRLFVVEQPGRIRIIVDGTLAPTPFLDIRDRVRTAYERGLLSVAFPPRYRTKGYFYVNYTDRAGDTVVARYYLTDDPDVADNNSEEVILRVDQPYANHNGGLLVFGPRDGYLYIGMGDGGSGGDPLNHGQNAGTLLGTLLRIDVEAGEDPYAIPEDNPFVGDDAARDEIWAIGLRNPWRFSFDRFTADLYIADVGQAAWEEINFQPRDSEGGENYGWNIMEGTHCYGAQTCDQTGLVLPVAEYSRDGGCSVTGGFVYRGWNYPRMDGIYYYGDFCSGLIWGLRNGDADWENRLLLESGLQISTFGQDQAGNIYVADYGGALYLLRDSVVAQRFYPMILKDAL